LLLKWPIVCNIAVYIGPFQKHYFNYYEDSLMMAPLESETCSRKFCASVVCIFQCM